MYKILVVDDEPTVSIGIRNFLLASDLNLAGVETALNGFEAVDCLRMEHYDLVLTDIQMSRMSGIELMETIYMEQPNLPVVVISAHEKFDFAMKALRFGARDYLVKPVDQEELLRVVRGVLAEKAEFGNRYERSKLERPHRLFDPVRDQEILMQLVTERGLPKKESDDLLAELGDRLKGPCFGVVAVRLDLRQGGFSSREVLLQDRKLLKYAALNLLEESLSEWGGLAFSGFGNELIAIIQLQHTDGAEQGRSLPSQLHLVGQCVSMNLRKYLNVAATIGISSLRSDASQLAVLMEEAHLAADWKRIHDEQHVFYYEDIAVEDSLNMIEWMAQAECCVQRMKEGGHAEGMPDMTGLLRRIGHTEELMNSYLGMLVYRIYGLLLEHRHASHTSLRRFDPDSYFRGLSTTDRIGRLAVYIDEAAQEIGRLMREREMTIHARIIAYIRQHYRNPALKIQDIAGEVHFSSAYLGHLFKREMNQNVWDYVTELRIEEAKRLLIETDKKRYEIAYEVGYESPEHFSRMFKRCTGISPADYRRAGQGQGGAG